MAGTWHHNSIRKSEPCCNIIPCRCWCFNTLGRLTKSESWLRPPISGIIIGSHREKRLLRNELMGSVDTRSVVSKMTLALLEDSRWYQANYSMADHLDSGHNQGTDKVWWSLGETNYVPDTISKPVFEM